MRHTLNHSLLIILKAVLKGIARIPLCLAMAIAGYYFWKQYPMPWSSAAGLPLMLIGISMGIFSVYDLIVALISSKWRREHCPYCRSINKVKDILSPHNGFDRRKS
jgi:uncharacterized membrane protein